MFLCPYCKEKEYPKIDSLRIHCAKMHKVSSKQMYIDVILNGVEPTCDCGCGSPVKFLDTGRGFSRYIMGHNSKVEGNNNFKLGNAHEKSLATRKKMIENGEHKPFQIKETGLYWMEGKTKDNDERLKQMSETIKEKHGKKRSEKMRENRLNGTIQTLYGKEHPQWKGGVSSLNHSIRGNRELYLKWKYPILQEHNFKCLHCGNNNELQVHHNVETFSEILLKIAINNNWEYNLTTKLNNKNNLDEINLLKEKIKSEVIEYHVNNNVKGIALCKKCHKEEHSKQFINDIDDEYEYENDL